MGSAWISFGEGPRRWQARCSGVWGPTPSSIISLFFCPILLLTLSNPVPSLFFELVYELLTVSPFCTPVCLLYTYPNTPPTSVPLNSSQSFQFSATFDPVVTSTFLISPLGFLPLSPWSSPEALPAIWALTIHSWSPSAVGEGSSARACPWPSHPHSAFRCRL